MSKHKYITRIDSDSGTHGYEVRLGKYEDGKLINGTKDLVSKFFSDSHFKSQHGCRLAAARWRNAYLREHDSLHHLKQSARLGSPMTNSGRNTSGAIGVVYATHHKKNSMSHGYKAEWSVTVDGKRVQQRKEFACLRYGECEAFKMACAERYKHAGTIYITDKKMIPCRPDVPYAIEEPLCA